MGIYAQVAVETNSRLAVFCMRALPVGFNLLAPSKAGKQPQHEREQHDKPRLGKPSAV